MRAISLLALATLAAVAPIACYDVGALTSDREAAESGADAGARNEAGVSDDASPLTDASPLSPTDGATSDAPPADAGPSWKLYSRSIFSPTQWNHVDVAAVWSGPNAPPARDIRAAVKLNVVDRLLVLTADTLYMREAGVWAAPQPLSATMPLLVGRNFHGAMHTPDMVDGAPGTTELVTFSDNPTAWVYRTNGVVFSFFDSRTLSDATGAVPTPQGSKHSRWAVTLIDGAKQGTNDWLNLYEAYEGDPNIYFFNATGWAQMWAAASCPLFAGTTGTPPLDDVMAGYNDDQSGVMYLVVR